MTVVATDASIREFLVWVARCPRTYRDAMEAWGSHCPRFTVWEDALAGGLVAIDEQRGVPIVDAAIRLTPLGRSGLPDCLISARVAGSPAPRPGGMARRGAP